MEKQGLLIIGGGNLGKAIVNGLLRSDELPYQLHLSKRNPDSIVHLAEKGVQIHAQNAPVISQVQLIIIAVKPYDVAVVLSEIAPFIDPKKHLVISLATGVSSNTIRTYLPPETVIFRAMPNTATDIAQSITCISTENTTEQEKDTVKVLFEFLGTVLFIKEELMEAATVLGACGIAYVLRFMRSMVQGGIQIGFDSKTAGEIVNQVVKGAAQLLIERKAHPEEEIDKVTTPKGCTIVGLNEMEHNGFSSALIKGISTSYKGIMN